MSDKEAIFLLFLETKAKSAENIEAQDTCITILSFYENVVLGLLENAVVDVLKPGYTEREIILHSFVEMDGPLFKGIFYTTKSGRYTSHELRAVVYR